MSANRILTVLILVSILPASASGQSVRYVDDDAPSGGDGLSWTSPYADLQDALTAAAGDPTITEIHVAGGTYTPSEQLPLAGPRSATFLLADGLAILGGYAGLADPGDPDVRDLALYESTLSGDLAGDDQPNWVNRDDNGFHVVFANAVDDTAVLDGFAITAGNANGSTGDIVGGGMINFGGSPTLTHCTFHGNQAAMAGGGMFNADGSPTLTNCAFMGNLAETIGGGGMETDGGSPTLTNCIFSGNSAENVITGAGGGGLIATATSGSPTLTNCTFSGNSTSESGGGILNANVGLTLANCILWGNTDAVGLQIADAGGGTTTATYSCIQGGWSGTGNTSLDPRFIDAVGADGVAGTFDDDLRLTVLLSPCIDSGSNAAVPLDTIDLDGDGDTAEPIPFDLDRNMRFFDDPAHADTGSGTAPIVDMGAYEHQFNDCNETGTPDWEDILDGTSADCNDNAIPDECDIADGFSLDCNENGVPDNCDLESGFSQDCNANEIPDECDIADGVSVDCNANGIPDPCDLESGFSLDCNTNGIPDACDIGDGVSSDCDADGVPDTCAADSDGDGIIDACDPCPVTRTAIALWIVSMSARTIQRGSCPAFSVAVRPRRSRRRAPSRCRRTTVSPSGSSRCGPSPFRSPCAASACSAACRSCSSDSAS